MTIWGTARRYQGSSGISRGYLLVRQGAEKSARLFLPTMPPSTHSGMVTSAQMTRMMMIVVQGRAAVVCEQGLAQLGP